jgi:hypothetical protein
MDFADPHLGLSSAYWITSILFSFFFTTIATYLLRQRSITAVSYKTFGIVFVLMMTLFIIKKIL